MTDVADTLAAVGRLTKRPSARQAAVAGGVVGGMTFLAYLPGIGRSLDFDSAQTVGDFVRQGPPWSVFSRQEVFNNHPLFSFLEQLVRVITGRTDATAMRFLPIAFGAITVGVLTWYCVRRFGLLAGVVAGIVVAANPTFAELSRAVRGYSLLALCALVSTLLLIREIESSPTAARSRARDVAYVAAVAGGVATHLFMGVVLVVHVAIVVATKRLDSRWRERFLAAGALGGLAYLGMIGDVFGANAQHTRVFQLGLPWDITKVVLGDAWAALVLAPVVIVGLVILVKRPAGRYALLASAGAFVALWAGMRSSALADRFFMFVIPGIGFLVAAAVARRPQLAVVALAAAGLSIASFASSYSHDPNPFRESATLIRSVDAHGARSCVVDVGIPAMRAYVDEGRDFLGITDPSQLDRCDVVVVAANWNSDADWYAQDRAIIAAARARYPIEFTVGSTEPALVFADRAIAVLR